MCVHCKFRFKYVQNELVNYELKDPKKSRLTLSYKYGSLYAYNI